MAESPNMAKLFLELHKAVRERAQHWRELGELFRESHPDITAWYIQFADELEELLKDWTSHG